ncbi:MAG: MFS transporter [Erysipelotrichaceae bacterium]|nr:MFS transporter [Erysipelotrichaceae bacterium]
MLILAYIGYGFGQLYFFFFAKSVVQVVIARLIAGVFIGAISVSDILYILENAEPENKGKSLAALVTVNAIFAAFGYLVGGVLGDYSLKLCLGLEVVGLWLLSPLHLFLLKDKEREGSKEKVGELLKEANPLKAFILPKEVLNRVFISFLLICALTSFASISNIGTIAGSLVSGFVYEVSPKGSFVYAAVSFALAIICAIIQQKSSNTSQA